MKRLDRDRGRGSGQGSPKIWWPAAFVVERKRFALTARRFARLIRINPSTLSYYERRASRAPATVVLAAMRVLLRYGRAGSVGPSALIQLGERRPRTLH